MTLHGVMGASGHCDTVWPRGTKGQLWYHGIVAVVAPWDQGDHCDTTGPHETKDSCNSVGHMEERDCFDTVRLHGAKESIVIIQEKRELLQMIQLLDFFNVTSVRGLFIFAQGEGN